MGNAETINAMYDAFAKGDIPTVLGAMDDKIEWNNADIIDAGDTVVVEARYRGTFKATGKQLDAQVAHVFDFRDGKAIRFQQVHRYVSVREGHGRTRRSITKASIA